MRAPVTTALATATAAHDDVDVDVDDDKHLKLTFSQHITTTTTMNHDDAGQFEPAFHVIHHDDAMIACTPGAPTSPSSKQPPSATASLTDTANHDILVVFVQ